MTRASDETGEFLIDLAPSDALVAAAKQPAADPPDGGVAVVAVDVPLAHLDRGFEYLIPAERADDVRPGIRVKVRFAGRDLDGFVLEVRDRPQHSGRLHPLRRVVSSEQVLTSEILALVRRVADDHVGTLSDVLRLAVPPRHARAEKALDAKEPQPQEPLTPPASWAAWAKYPAGNAFIRRLTQGENASAAWSALPGQIGAEDWPAALAEAAMATLLGGRGALVVVPDGRDVKRVDAELTRLLGTGRHVVLTAEQGPQARYTAWLKVLRGQVRCVLGTRAAAFAPVQDLGLAAWWDDGDDSLAEPRAPYPHVREVLRTRAELTGASLLAGGFTRSCTVQSLVEEGVMREVVPDPGVRRAYAPRVHIAGEGYDEERDGPGARAHLPGAAWRAAHSACDHGPVLVQVPRRGYLPALSCARCRTQARCPTCSGPLSLDDPNRPPSCRWCHRPVVSYRCGNCGGEGLRSSVIGAKRTAEELGRAFPGVPVVRSGAGTVLDTVPGESSLVIATPGAEPVAEGGYAAVLLLDAWASLDRPVLDSAEQAFRRWCAAAALARPRAPVVLAGAPNNVLPSVEALVRWTPEWFAGRELQERQELSLPPAAWVAALRGPRRALTELVDLAALPDDVDRLGPVPVPGSDDLHVLIRASSDRRPEVVRALTAAKAVRSARREEGVVRIRIGTVEM